MGRRAPRDFTELATDSENLRATPWHLSSCASGGRSQKGPSGESRSPPRLCGTVNRFHSALDTGIFAYWAIGQIVLCNFFSFRKNNRYPSVHKFIMHPFFLGAHYILLGFFLKRHFLLFTEISKSSVFTY